ncbi:hypothetical protein QFC22_002527 [Naganishia vaughanmartiniae]|uniref:Uncharacterized protein n=1 Tax=Naganishia vaughanmartiniae TaxID=1424756 RepID=A0ACC2X9X2_9TREE|nr:hypothetical protein QFC22_002527 [Naganishia vaughanmartiniae]
MAITRKRPTLPKLNGKPSGPKPKHGQPRRDAAPKAQPADAKKKEDGAPEKRGKWGKKPKPKADEDEEDSGYDEAPAASDDEDGFNFDLTSSLAGPPATSRFKAARTTSAPSAKAKGGRPAAMEVDEEDEEEEEIKDDDEDAEIMAMMGKKSFKDGATVAKAAVGKGKGKDAKSMVGGGSWQSMGLAPQLLRSLLLRGYKTPTPIQRASIPHAIAQPPRDLVGMARTGSGKTLAYVIPLLQRLGGKHSLKFGARALILCPSRELAWQIRQVGKEMAKGFKSGRGGSHAGDDKSGADGNEDGGSAEDLRWEVIMGGESLDEQFAAIARNPDVIIATPGRLLHLIIEMNLDLRSMDFVVFDEADRLFEMGFEVQMQEILSRLPSTRQTLLFSATLPKSLVEFAKAGLVNPKLIRLDAESKISSDLQMAFFSIKPNEKEAALLALLRDVIKTPLAKDGIVDFDDSADMPGSDDDDEMKGGATKRKGFGYKGKGSVKHINEVAPHQAIIFTATKHHVEYITTLLKTAGYSASHIYGSLDQMARRQQMDRFKRGQTNLLVVTDVAARGIDIPVLENVVNYDFPSGSRVFVHRVGRTARAGRKGWAWSFVTNTELPYLLDLQLFLGRPLVSSKTYTPAPDAFSSSLVLGTMPRESLDANVEYVATSLTESQPQLPILKEVTRKSQMMYERSQGKASQESYRRAKAMTKDESWQLAGNVLEDAANHPVYAEIGASVGYTDPQAKGDSAEAKASLLAQINSYQPTETIFEIGSRGKTPGAEIMRQRRSLHDKIKRKRTAQSSEVRNGGEPDIDRGDMDVDDDENAGERPEVEMADESDIENAFETSKKPARPTDFKDDQFYMSHYQQGAAADRGYSLKDGQSFIEQARNVTMDLVGDEGVMARTQKASQLTWDRKKKKFIQGDGAGADNQKIIRTESGARLPISYKSGRFEEWKAKKRISLPKIGEAEGDLAGRVGGMGDKRYRHTKTDAAKPLDAKSTTFEKKTYLLKKRAEKEAEGQATGQTGLVKTKKGKVVKAARSGTASTKSELKSVQEIRKQRQIQEQRRAKNARPSAKNGKGKGKGKSSGNNGKR